MGHSSTLLLLLLLHTVDIPLSIVHHVKCNSNTVIEPANLFHLSIYL